LTLHTPRGYVRGVVSEVVCPGRCPKKHRLHSRSTPAPIDPLQRNGTDMCGTEYRTDTTPQRTQLPLTGAAAGGCSCCSPAGSASVALGAVGRSDVGIPAAGGTAAGEAQFSVEGLTCGHCVRTVEQAVSALPGVEDASVELVAGGRSRLVIAGAVDASAVQQAVSSAGYTFVPSRPGQKEES
jgi:copper chaperone